MNSSNSFQHCLHPTLTKLLVKRLRERISINLVGKVEHGRSRILEDIQQCDVGEVKVVLAVTFFNQTFGIFNQIFKK